MTRKQKRTTALGILWLVTLAMAVMAAGPEPAPAAKDSARHAGRVPKILVVLTGVDRVPGHDRETGFWAEEYVVPVQLFKRAGFRVTAATIAGGRAPVDPASIDPAMVGPEHARAYRLGLDRNPEFQRCVPLGKVSAKGFSAIFVVGGHGVMWDLTHAPDMAALVRTAVAKRILVAAVCHAPGALLDIALPDGRTFLAGQKVTGFSRFEEDQVQMTAVVPYGLEEELTRESGGLYSKAEAPWGAHVVENDGLILGQNPASSEATAKAVLIRLQSRGHSR